MSKYLGQDSASKFENGAYKEFTVQNQTAAR